MKTLFGTNLQAISAEILHSIIIEWLEDRKVRNVSILIPFSFHKDALRATD